MSENIARFIASLIVASVLVLLFRALALTIYTIPRDEKACGLAGGDRVVVSRWSYGLRSGDDRLFPYARLFPSKVNRGDVVAFNPPCDSIRPRLLRRVLIGRVTALPGDTVSIDTALYELPLPDCPCANLGAEHYMVSTEGGRSRWIVNERHIIGRALIVLYSREPGPNPLAGYRKNRAFIPIR